MTKEALAWINTWLTDLNIPYEFMEWSSDVPSTYFVGEYDEIETIDEEGGREEATFMITGTTNSKFIDLETAKETIRNDLGHTGKTTLLNSGSGLAITYENAIPIPSVEEGVRRIQINLYVKEWRV